MFCITQEAIDQQNAAAVKAAQPPGRTVHADFQGDLSPAHLASLRQTGEGAPLGSSYREHARATADVQVLDGATAADYAATLARLGPRRPSGVPGQPPFHTAPTGADSAGFRVNASRDMSGLPSVVTLTSVGRHS